jgi:hypothetical protein
MTTKNTSKVDGLHRYMNDVTMTIGAAVLGFAVVGILSYWEYSNRQARQQRASEQCPSIATKFGVNHRVDDNGCSIQASDGQWVSINIQ